MFAFIAILGIIATNDDTTGKNIINSISIGFIVSLVFWFIVVELPEKRRSNIIKRNISLQYKYFKKSMIDIILKAADVTCGYETKEKLLDFKFFRAYFNFNDKMRWYAFVNSIDDDNSIINDIFIEIDVLNTEISYVLNNVQIADEKIYSLLKLSIECAYRLKHHSVFSSDLPKYLSDHIYSIMACWSRNYGYLNSDIIQDAIDSI